MTTIASTVVLTAVLTTACSSTAPPPGPRAAVTATATSLAAATAHSAVPTIGAGATSDGAAFPVALTEEVATRQVLSWLDPTRSPRIEPVRYVRREDFLAAWRDSGIDLLSMASGWSELIPAELLSPVVIIVVATSERLELLGELSDLDTGTSCELTDPPERERIVLVFDAVTGKPVVTATTEMQSTVGVAEDRLAALPEAPVVPVERPLTEIPLPTDQPSAASPSPTPPAIPADAPALSPQDVPAALLDALRAWPLLPGNHWTWRVTSREGGVRWRTAIVTETVDAGWVLQPEMLLVRSSVSVDPVTREAPSEVGDGTLWHYVTPLGVFGAAERATDPALRRSDRNGYVDANGRPVAGVPLAPDHFLLLPSALANEIARLEEVARDLGTCVAELIDWAVTATVP